MSVVPDCGKYLLIFMLKMRTDEEQSNVPLVLKRMMVGMPACATLVRGWYPPFARISMICLPSTMLTLFASAELSVEGLPRESMKAPPMSMTAIDMDSTSDFM